MKTRLFIVSVFLVGIALLALLMLGEGWPTVAQSQQAAACNDSFEFVHQWGTTGSGPGQFQAPVAVAVDRDGNVHVVDRDNRRIQKFDPQGNYLLEYGNEDGRYMINPNGVEVGPNGYMYIADTGQHRILYYSALGNFIDSWKDGDGSEWRMLNPWGVAGWEYSGTKNVYVVDRNACQILRFHSNGQFIDDWGHCDSAPYLPSAPQDVATYPTYNSPPNFLYVADTGGNRVMQFDYRLTWLKNWGTAGSGDGEFNEPSSVATDASGCVYVADTNNHRVQVFNGQGGFVTKFGSQGSEPGRFQGPRGVAVDGDGCVYVADTGNDRIQVFCPQSPLPTPTSTPGTTPTPSPTPICEVPFFWQVDPRWSNHPLRTNGVCSPYCGTIGHCGCTLTSATMVFNYYGANLTPPILSDCMGTSACSFYWGVGAQCSGYKARWISRPRFSWSRLDQELNQNHRPVILGMHRRVNGNTHWVVVTRGQGSDPVNYYIHDPAFEGGANMKLDARSRDYDFDWLAIYEGQATCSSSTSMPLSQSSRTPQPVLFATDSGMAGQGLQLTVSGASALSSSSSISGTVWVYRMTAITMTVKLTAQSSAGNVTEMLVWSDSISNTTWQPFTPFTWLSVSDFVYARFRDEFGSVTEAYSDTIHPIGPPTAPNQIFLPLILKQ